MKRHGNLFNQIVIYANLQLACKNAQKGKHYTAIRKINDHLDKYLTQLQESLINKTFTTSAYDIFRIHEPKEREIFRLPYYPDRIVQHAILNILGPIWDKIFIYDVYSSVPNKGIHSAIKRLKYFLKDKINTQYCLQYDISKFYPSVNHIILQERVRQKIKCKDTLWLLDNIINSPSGNKGIPIGNYTSQYFANVYLDGLDHYIKQDLKCKYYIRYADDGIILNNNKDKLHNIQDKLSRYLQDKLLLEFNPKTQIYPIDNHGIDFLGYRTFRDYVLLRKRSVKKFKSKIKEIKNNHVEAQHIISSVMSYLGWIQHCNGYNLIKKYILEDKELLSIMDKASKQLGFDNPIRSKYGTV